MIPLYAPEKILAVLENGRQKISNPATWIKGAFIKKMSKKRLEESGGNQLYAYCAIGAVGSATKELGGNNHLRNAAREVLMGATDPPSGPEVFNDDPITTHEDVLALFDRAIERTKEQING